MTKQRKTPSRYTKIKSEKGMTEYRTKAGELRYRIVLNARDGRTLSKAGFREKGAARAWRNAREAEIDNGSLIHTTDGNVRFAEFAADWLTVKIDADKLRPTTQANYEYQLTHQLARWNDWNLSKITPMAVKKWEAETRTTPGVRTGRAPAASSVAKSLKLMKQIMASALENRMIPFNPLAGVKVPQSKRPADMYCPTYADVLKLADVVDDEHRALILVMGLGGLRWGEAVGLTRQRVDVANGCVDVREIVVETLNHDVLMQEAPKTEAGRRTVKLHPTAVDALARHLLAHTEPGDDGLLFHATRQGTGERPYLRRSNFYGRVWKPALKSSGLPRFRVHDLRHAAATMAAQTGATTAELMAHIGHTTPAAAMRYQHASRERLDHMADRMAEMFPAPETAATGTDNVVPLRPQG